jgi:cobalamin synthase
MAEDKMNPPSDALERRIILALETAPRTKIPEGFAARVAAQLPSRAAVVLTPRRYGPGAAVACLVVLMVLMAAFAQRATGSSWYWFSMESTFCAQFALLAVWLAARGFSSAR